MHEKIENLHLMILNKKEDAVKEILIKKEIDLEEKMDNGFTYLHCAVHANLLAIIEILLDKGANINAQDVYGKTPVMLSLATDRTQEGIIVNYLLDRGADASIKTYKNIAAKEFATRIGLSKQIIDRL